MRFLSSIWLVMLVPVGAILGVMYVGPIIDGNTPGVLPMTWYTPDGHFVEPVAPWEHSRYNVKIDGKTWEQIDQESYQRSVATLCAKVPDDPLCQYQAP